ncbi:hypothetical protein [Halorientalis pallida]|uniref:Uncharacterized protein n=1 Tax=Halorientalis pallida TaxID=2479928 RepID=A0A498L148_9EURY|nr:hypothetical protein [Halorientalis pallida]RXK51696.1 hypothetical protein EAF64_03435 [Halorientalis pallida]
MSEFASCYFCGTALDAQIEAYPVVPESAGGGDQPTVDLCPVCRRKLSKVLDVALSAAEGAEAAATPLAAGPDPSPLEADHEDPTADLESEDDGDEPAYAVEPSGEATAVEGNEGERSEPSREPSGERSEPRDSEAEADADGIGTANDGAEKEAAADTDEPVAAEPETEDGSAETTSDGESTSAETAEADDAVANGEVPGTAADDGAGGADEDGTTETGSPGPAESGSDQPSILSTPAAQKIIKLLQNREFPIDREEIEVVASNAYEIPAQDCDDVIEALVSEGYVGQRKGKLVRPEE